MKTKKFEASEYLDSLEVIQEYLHVKLFETIKKVVEAVGCKLDVA